MGQIKFGTDGWRAVIAEDFTFANVERVAQATALYWKNNSPRGTSPKAVVGYDRRFFSDQFARRSAEVLAANEFEVLLTPRPTPTPSVSFAVKSENAVGGVMLTASHNPPIFNGFKLKAHYGGSADPQVCAEVEALLDKQPAKAVDFEDALKRKQIRFVDVQSPHFAALKKLVDFKLISRSGLRFAHEALFGVGAGCFEELLKGTTCKVSTLNGAHDVLFGGINPEPIAKNYTFSSAFLRKHPHDVCLVTDGDADRVGAMDGHGVSMSTHQVICLLLHHFYKNQQVRGRVVKALTTTSMVDKMCAEFGLEMVETGVGFKYIAAEMLKGDVLLGAEESGGIGFPNHIPERDGIAAGLFLLELLATERKSINRLIASLDKRFGPHRYGRSDIHFPLEKRAPLMQFLKDNPPSALLTSPLEQVKSFDGVKFIARDSSWLMLRGSGTEPILRIYAEAPSPQKVERLLKLGVRLTREV